MAEIQLEKTALGLELGSTPVSYTHLMSTILAFDELNFRNIFEFLSKGQEQANIDIDDVILTNWGRVSEPYTCLLYTSQ